MMHTCEQRKLVFNFAFAQTSTVRKFHLCCSNGSIYLCHQQNMDQCVWLLVTYTTNMTKVLVLAGGNSDERAVSLRSGSAVMAALHTAGYDVLQLDPAEQDIDYGQRLET
jgi:hypothetical protein